MANVYQTPCRNVKRLALLVAVRFKKYLSPYFLFYLSETTEISAFLDTGVRSAISSNSSSPCFVV